MALRRENKENQRTALVGTLLLALAVFIIAYYAITVPTEKSFGERYVDAEIPLIFPFYVISSFKPVTLMTYLIFGGTILLLEASGDRLKRLNLRGTRIFLLLISFAAGYEVIWNFFAWFITWERAGGLLDLLANTEHHYTQLPANFNFVTKISFLVFALSLYGSLFIEKLERSNSHTNSS